MNRVTKLKWNTVSSLINRFVLIISGLILPRLILSYYGSEINGLVSSLNQFLSVITFLDLGIGTVVQSAMYKPLANEDIDEISRIFVSAKNYFNRIAYILIVYVIILIFIYPFIIDESLSFLPTAFLIISLSISFFANIILA